MAILNDLVVKGPAKFLGSVDANLNVISAEKLTTSAGAGVNPIYFSGGKPVACTYTLEKSVPSNAVFTDNSVTNTLATTTKAYVTGTTSSSTNTGTQVFDTGVYLDTTAGMLTATTFKGALSGNASTATKLATARTIYGKTFDGSGDVEGFAYMYGYHDTSSNTFNSYEAGLQLRENNLVLANSVDMAYAPAISFHWGNVAASKLLLHSDGKFYFKTQAGDRSTIDANIIGDLTGTASNADTVDNMHAWTWGALNASGYFDGSDYLAAKYNFYGDGRYGIFSGSGTHVRCEYATNAGNVVSLRTHNSYADIFSTSLAYGHACWNKWTFISGQSSDSTAAGYVVNAPYSSAALWYEVLTMGIANRAFQLAIGCFTHQRDMFIRYMHDAVWSGWFKINTTAI